MKIRFVFLVIFLFSLIAITWFKGSELIAAGDNYFFLNLPRYLNTLTSAWRDNNNLGGLEYNLEFHLPFALFFIPADLVGISYPTAERAWLVLSLFLPGVFMYFFLTAYFGDLISKPFKLLGALFYMFNQYAMLQPLGIVLTKFPIYITLPIFGCLLIKFFESSNSTTKFRYAAALSLSTILLGGAFRNVAEVASFCVVESLLYVFLFFRNKAKRKNIMFTGFFLIFSVLFNFWWLYSSFLNQFISRDAFVGSVAKFDAGGSLMFDSLRLMGFWALPSYFKNVLYYPFGVYFYSFLAVVGTFAISIVSFFPLAYLPKSNLAKNHKVLILFVIFLMLVGITLVKGRTSPFGGWYNSLYGALPVFSIFREPFSKFSLISVFSFTLGISAGLFLINRVLSRIHKRFGVIISCVFAPLLLYIAFPMFNGQIHS